MKKLLYLFIIVSLVSCSAGHSETSSEPAPSGQNKALSAISKDDPKDLSLGENNKGTDSDDDFIQTPLDPKDITSPMISIKNLDAKVESYYLGKDLTQEQLDANQKLKKEIIRGTFDIKELCRLSLGKHWTEITPAQQKQFVNLMTTLLETKAIFSKEQLRGSNKYYQISYNKEVYDDAEKKKSTVFTKMNVPKEKMNLDITYKMLLTPYGWKIFDVIVDDASLLSNYKFQFDRIITKSGFDDLISRMETKLDKIKGN